MLTFKPLSKNPGAPTWIKALENDPKEIRAAAVDAQRSTDWLLARERSREDDKAAPERPDGDIDQTREPRDPDRPPCVLPEVTTSSQTDQHEARRDREPSPQAFNREMASDRQRNSGPSPYVGDVPGRLGKATNGVRGGVWVPIAGTVS